VTRLGSVAKLTCFPGYTLRLVVCSGWVRDSPCCSSGIASMNAGLSRSTEILIASPLTIILNIWSVIVSLTEYGPSYGDSKEFFYFIYSMCERSLFVVMRRRDLTFRMCSRKCDKKTWGSGLKSSLKKYSAGSRRVVSYTNSAAVAFMSSLMLVCNPNKTTDNACYQFLDWQRIAAFEQCQRSMISLVGGWYAVLVRL